MGILEISAGCKRKKESLGKIARLWKKSRSGKYPSLAANIRSQFKFQSWKYWALQGGILVAAMALVLYLSRVEADGEGAISVCAVFLVFAGNIGLSGLGRLFSRNMAELEQTLYLNLKQMVCIQMLFGGAADLLVLGMIVGIAGGQMKPVPEPVFCICWFLFCGQTYCICIC